MTLAKSNDQQPNNSTNTPSAYAAAQRAQTWRRLRRWLPLDEGGSRLYADLAARLRPAPQWAEAVAQVKAWLLAQPERWLHMLTTLRAGRPLRRMSLSQLVALALSAGLTAGMVSQPFVALAQGLLPVGDEFQVNTYTTGAQRDPNVGMDTDGDFVIAWSSGNYDGNGQDGNSHGIYAQRYNTDGQIQGSEFQVNTYTTGSQFAPSVGVDAEGGFVITWESYGQEDEGTNIYARLYDANGTAKGSEFRVNTYTTGMQRYPRVGLDSDGDFVIAWQSNNYSGYQGGQDGDYIGIYVQRYDASGTPLGSEFQVNSYTTGFQRDPSVGIDDDGDFVIAWESGHYLPEDGQDGDGGGIYAQRYDASGTAQGSEFRVNTITTGSQRNSSVGLDADGDFVIAWTSAQDGDNSGIYAQRYGADGLAQGSAFQVVNTDTTGYNPSVKLDTDGDFVIAWTSQDGDYSGIYAQRYSADGLAQGSAFQVNTYTTGHQINPNVGMDAKGNFVIAWQSGSFYAGDGQDGDYMGVYAQRYTLPTSSVYLPLITKS